LVEGLELGLNICARRGTLRAQQRWHRRFFFPVGAAGFGVLAFPCKSGFIADRFDQQADRGCRSGRRIQGLVFRLAGIEGPDSQLFERLLPYGNEIPRIEIEEIANQIIELRLDGLQLADIAEHPVVTLELLRNGWEFLDESVLETRIGVKSGDGNLLDVVTRC